MTTPSGAKPFMYAFIANTAEPDVAPAWVPMPLEKELAVRLSARLGDTGSVDDYRILRYMWHIGVAPPEPGADEVQVGEIAACLSGLSPDQQDSLTRLCVAFDLTFAHVADIFDFLSMAKGVSKGNIAAAGVPSTPDIL